MVKARNIAMWDPAAANGEGRSAKGGATFSSFKDCHSRWSSLCDSNPPNRCDIDGVSYRGTSAQAASPVYVFSLAYHAASNMLYVGGLFQSAGQRYANINSLAAFSLTSKSWSIVGGGIAGPSPVVHALYISPGSQDLYVAGSFSAVGKQNSGSLLSMPPPPPLFFPLPILDSAHPHIQPMPLSPSVPGVSASAAIPASASRILILFF